VFPGVPKRWLESLRARVLLGVSAVLVVLFGVTIFALDQTFERSTDQAIEALLEAQLLGLIALADEGPDGKLTLPDETADPRFNVADSGLYAALWNSDGERVWQSLSLVGREIDLGPLPEPGERRYGDIVVPGLPPGRGLLMGIGWEFADGRIETFALGTGVSLAPYDERQRSFHRNLIGWFVGMTAVMLIVIAILMHRVLQPVRTLERQVSDIEVGHRSALSGRYPIELRGLARNLNALIDTERRRQVRYRNTLDDLAHSLKTPLAVMRSVLGDATRAASDGDEDLSQAVDRMEERVGYQLRRARASGTTGLGLEPVRIEPILRDLMTGLDKVYRGKQVAATIDAGPDVVFLGDSGDFTELAGNLIENAYKYGRQRVRVEAENDDGSLRLIVEDDGSGIPAELVEQIMLRGARADESVPGEGIGLAVAREICELYQGGIDVGASRWGGARIVATLKRATLEN
jgi:two-component system sensor histidine kinase PhoQ